MAVLRLKLWDTKSSAMNSALVSRARRPASYGIFWIRLPVGLIFFTQGLLKYYDPNLGVNRFTKIGFPHPYFTAHVVGAFEIVCGALVLLSLWTRLASVPLLIIISTAIATIKIPELFRANQGFWYMVSDARTDFAMFCCLIFLLISGGGAWSLNAQSSEAEDPR
jgi:putative oxidoreductase